MLAEQDLFLKLFIWLHRVSLELAGFSCGAWGLLKAVRGLGYSVACGILVPQPWSEHAFPVLQGIFLTTGPPGKSLGILTKVSLRSVPHYQAALPQWNSACWPAHRPLCVAGPPRGFGGASPW